MSDRVQAEIIHEDQNVTETVRESDAPVEKKDVGTAIDEYLAAKKAAHPEWYASEAEVETTDPPETEQEQTEAAEQEQEAAATEQAGDTDSEPESKALKRILDREAKLREDKKVFEEEVDQFKDFLLEFEEAKRYAKSDPVSFLKTLGVSQEELIDVAKAAYYESLGDMAPDDYKGQKELQQLRREIAELKASKKAPEAEPDNSAYEQELVAYQNSMLEATKTFDTESLPYVARVVEAYSEADVAADMFSVAQEHAIKMNGQGEPLTPEQCLAEVNSRYQKLLGKLAPQQVEAAEPAPEPGSKRKKATLSNSLSSNVPPEQPLSADMSYEEIKARARANFFKSFRDSE